MSISVLQQVNGTDTSAAGLTFVVTIVTGAAANSSIHLAATCDAGFDFSGVTGVVSVPSLTWSASPLDDILDSGNARMGHWKADGAAASTSYTITGTYNSASTTFRACSAKEIGQTTGYDSTANAHKGNDQGTGNLPTTAPNAVTSTNLPVLTSQPALISGFSFQCNTSGSTQPNIGTTLSFVSDGIGWKTGGANTEMRGESARVTATTAVAATFTAIANNNHISVAAAFLEAASGATRPVKMAGEWGGYAGESGGFAG